MRVCKRAALVLLGLLACATLALLAACKDKVDTPPETSPTEETKFTVTFLGREGDTLKTQSVKSGEDATPPEAPQLTGFEFDKWEGSYTNVTADVSVRAVYLDTGAPVLSFVGKESLTVDLGEHVAGTAVELPAAKATDNADGDIASKIRAICEEGTITKVGVTDGAMKYTFTAPAKGTYQIIFKVSDSALNAAENGTVTVRFTAATQDAAVTAEENKLENLNTLNKPFKENFADMENNVFLGEDLDASFMGFDSSANAISGTSLTLNYNGGDLPPVVITSVSRYIKTFGVYRVRFKIKLLSGTAVDGFYVGLWPEDKSEQYNAQMELGQGFTANPGKAMEFNECFSYAPQGKLTEAKPMNLAIFALGNPEMSLAIDDVEIVFLGARDAEAADKLLSTGSITFNQVDRVMAAGFTNVVDRPAELAEEAGFSEKVLAVDNWSCYPVKFASMSGLFKPGYSYRISFKYYWTVEDNNKKFLGYPGDFETLPNLQNTANQVLTYDGVISAKTGLDILWIFSLSKPVKGYIGDITISVTYTAADLARDGSKTWTHTGGLDDLGVVNAEVTDRPAALAEAAGFSEKVLLLNNTTVGNAGFEFVATTDLFEVGKTYTISFSYYVLEAEGWLFNGFTGSGTGLNAFAELKKDKNTVFKQEVTFTAKEGDKQFMIYTANHPFKAYLGDFTITVKPDAGQETA